MGKRFRVIAVLSIAACSWCYPSAASAAGCPNEDLRVGDSAGLPSCRAYELVSPENSNGRLIQALTTGGLPATVQVVPSELASPVRDSIAFLAYQNALPEPAGATGIADVYEAERTEGGWQTSRHLAPSGLEASRSIPGGVSPDHLYGFTWISDPRSPLSIKGAGTLYLVQPDNSLEMAGIGSLGSEPYAEGRYLGEGGQHVIFSTGKDSSQSFLCNLASSCKVLQLEPDAPPTGTGAVYDREADGETHVVSLLPGDVPLKAGEKAFYRGTSKDGSATAFEVENVLYVRLDNQETKQVAPGKPIFAGLSDDGGFIFYVVPGGPGEAGEIHRLDTASGIDVVVNPGDDGSVVNISGDGSHVYFISEAQLDGAKGTAGQPNLYVWSGGPPRYIATVQPSDLVRTSDAGNQIPALTNWTSDVTNKPDGEQGPGANSSRTTPDGTVIIFESRAQLTAYDNANPLVCPSEVLNPEGRCTEIYRFEEGDTGPECVSCNIGKAPEGSAQLQDLKSTPTSNIVHNVSDDGTRVFFETDEALSAKDTDGINDIYEWHEGDGDPMLISSGQSENFAGGTSFDEALMPNVILSITPDGADVVFVSQDALVLGAPGGGARAIYDARINGGFPLPPESKPCAEEGCRPALSGQSSVFPNAPSESATSSGNVKPKKKHRRRHCRHKKHGKCSKHKPKNSQRRRTAAGASTLGAAGQQADRGAAAAAPSGPVSSSEPGGQELSTQDGSSRPRSSSVATSAAEPSVDYGIEEVSAGLSTTTAGMHPDFSSDILLNHLSREDGNLSENMDRTEEVAISIPPGLIGNINAVPRCPTARFVVVTCPTDSQVGITTAYVTFVKGPLTEPVYNLEPPHPDKEIARFGFTGALFPVFIDIKVRTASDYGVSATVSGPSGLVSLVGAKTTLWGNPASPKHDEQRLTPLEANKCKTACEAEEEGPNGEIIKGKRASTIPVADRKAFMTNPSACQTGQMDVAVKSYQSPTVFTASAALPDITDCTGLPFAPSFTAEPTNHAAGAPTGLHTTLTLPQHLGEEERSTATMREARVTLPAGMQIAAGAANWIGTCSEAQVGFHKEVDTACPDSSKLGTATISSPALPESIEGAIYQRNPAPGHQFGLWLTADALGLHIKLPGELEPDKATGRLTAVFRDLPQVPVGQIDLDVWGGSRAPLQNPDHCGTYTTDYSFSPHSNDPAAAGQSTMQITEGCGQPFSPTLHAGVTNPVAGAFSPLVVDLNRDDGQQALRGFELHLPDGELAKIKGVPLCSDADATAGTCPAGSRIGSLQATTGTGPDPLQVPQPGKPEPQIYLAGPYQGAPFSIVSEVPAQAGPFDLGVLAVRSGLQVDPETGQATVKADPLPQFFEGVGIAYRHLHAVVDRPEFSLNPTDCREAKVTSDVTSTQGATAHPAARFQIDGCKALKFKPKLSLKLKGGTDRADYPALTAILKARKGDANIAFTSVALPHSEFIAQEHFSTICTRKQFAVDKCPKGSVYGRAKAWTPLLDKPLSGPVYLRSSDHPLPDLVVKLEGQLEIHLVGRVDSVHGGIRASFESVPDAPVSKFVMRMRGGKKGLFVNSTDICRGAHKATVAMRAQNGRTANLRPRLVASGCGKHRQGGKKK